LPDGMMKQSIKMIIPHEKDFLLKNIKENLQTIKFINQYNSSILKNSINKTFKKATFTFNEQTNSIKITEDIKKINILGHEPLLTLISIEDVLEKKNYHLLSYSLENNQFYINFFLLKKLKTFFNEIYYEQLLSLKNYKNLKELLILLYKGFSFSINKDISETIYTFSNKDLYYSLLNILKQISNEEFNLNNEYYYFNVVDFNLYKHIKKDLNDIENNKILSLNNYTYLYNNISLIENKNIDTTQLLIPFGVKTDKNTDLIKNQKKILDNLNYSINYILGIAGSGKTFLLSRYFYNFKYFLALGVYNNIPLPILYTSYSNSTNYIFYENFQKLDKNINFKIGNLDFTISDLIFFIQKNENQDTNLNKKTIESIKKRLLINDKDIDINRLTEIELKLKNYNQNSQLFNTFKEYNNINNKLKNYLNIYSDKEKKILKQILYKIYIYLIKYKSFFNRLFYFINKEELIFNKEEIIFLKKTYPYIRNKFNWKNKKDYNFLIKIFKNGKSILKEKEKYTFETFLKDYNFKTTYIYEEDIEISNEDIIYYLLFFYYLKPKNEIEKYKNLLNKLLKYKEQEGMINNEQLIFKQLYPLHISNIADLGYYVPVEFNYYMTLVDESLLVPNYLTYSVLGRTTFLTISGDVSQMSFYHLLPKNALNKFTDLLYGKYKKYFSMYLNIVNYKINSFYDILSYQKPILNNKKNFNILTDNFRYPLNIYETLFSLSEEYTNYRSGIKKEKNIFNKQKIKLYWEKAKDIKSKYDSGLFFLESDKYNKSNNYIEILTNIKLKENYTNIDTFQKNKKITLGIITPFSSDKNDIERIINNLKKTKPELFLYNKNEKLYKNIEILSIYEIQGMEFDIVIFDTFLDKELKEYENMLSKKLQIMTVAISRTKTFFFLIGKIKYFNNPESDIHKNIRNVVKKSFDILE